MRYKVILNNRDYITIRDDELKSVLEGIRRGGVVFCREGIFNSSYFVAILEDIERENELRDEKFIEPSPFEFLNDNNKKLIS